jgi:hypothetical protein
MFDTDVGVLRVSDVCSAPFEKRTSKGTIMALTEEARRRRYRGRRCMKSKKERSGQGKERRWSKVKATR